MASLYLFTYRYHREALHGFICFNMKYQKKNWFQLNCAAELAPVDQKIRKKIRTRIYGIYNGLW